MLSLESFYNYFQLNHFDYKQEANRHLLELDEKSFEETYPGIESHKNILIVEEVLGLHAAYPEKIVGKVTGLFR